MIGRETVSRRAADVPSVCDGTRFASTTDASLVVNVRGECLDANQAACSLLGYDHDELLTLRLGDLLAGGPIQTTPTDSGIPVADTWAGELDLRRKDGALRHVEVQATLAQPGIYLVAVRDLTASQAPTTLQEDPLAMVSHELNTPLTILMGRAQLVRRRGAATTADIEAIIDHAAQLSHLIKDLHLASALEAGQFHLHRSEIDLTAVARSAVTRVHGDISTHTIRLDGPTSVRGTWDKECVQQVIESLLANAIKYSPAGSTIVVRVEDRSACAQVSVTDQGMGIAPDVVPLIFDRFFRTKDTVTGARGLGLGLYISKMLVEAHQGRIWIDSQLKKGTTVTFTLPRYGTATATEPISEPGVGDRPR